MQIDIQTTKDKSIGHGAVWSVIENFARQFLALIVFLITARFVSIEAFGVMAVSLLVVEFFKQTIIDSVGTAMTSTQNPDEADYNASFIIIFIASIILAIIVFLGADIVAAILGNEHIADALKLVSILLASMGLTRTHEAWLSRHMMFKILAIRSLFAIILGGAIGTFLAIKGYGLIALIVQQLVITFVSTIMLWVCTPWRPQLKTTVAKIVRLLKFSKHVMVTGATTIVNTQSDVFFSSFYLGEAATGIYNAAKRILMAMTLVFATSLNKVALPTFSNIHDGNKNLARAYLKSVTLTSILITPIFAGIAYMSHDLITILLGDKWLASAPILTILSISGYLAAIDQYNHLIMLVKNKPHWQSFLTTLFAVANILLLIIFARYGLTALAWAFVARTILFFPASVGVALYLLKLNISQYIRAIAPAILSAGIMLVILYLAHDMLDFNNSIINLFVSTIMGAIIYFVSFATMDRRSLFVLFAEIKNLKSMS